MHYPTSMRSLQKFRRKTCSLGEKEYWGFPKGHIEKNEKIEETANREVAEETGLKDNEFIKGFREKEEYFFTKKGSEVFKTVIFFLAETKKKEIKISKEHLGFKWLPYKEAIKKLTFKNAKKILTKANDFLSRKGLSDSKKNSQR